MKITFLLTKIYQQANWEFYMDLVDLTTSPPNAPFHPLISWLFLVWLG